jgi:hypothetical protein
LLGPTQPAATASAGRRRAATSPPRAPAGRPRPGLRGRAKARFRWRRPGADTRLGGSRLRSPPVALTARGDRWATPPGGLPVTFRHRLCSQHFTPTVACSRCGEPVAAPELVVLPGPGGRKALGTAV